MSRLLSDNSSCVCPVGITSRGDIAHEAANDCAMKMVQVHLKYQKPTQALHNHEFKRSERQAENTCASMRCIAGTAPVSTEIVHCATRSILSDATNFRSSWLSKPGRHNTKFQRRCHIFNVNLADCEET